MTNQGNSNKVFWQPLLPLCIFIALYPLAVAGQNIGAGVALLCMAPFFLDPRNLGTMLTRLSSFRLPIAMSIIFTASILFSTSLNSVTPAAEPWRYVASHLNWILMPVLAVAVPPLSSAQWQVLRKTVLWVCCVFGAAAVSQHFFPWQVQGVHFVAGTIRARGFYSHPLTYAYAAFLLWPFCIGNVLENNRSILSWLGFLGIALALVLSESRTILLIAAALYAYNALFRTRGKMRALMVAIGISAFAGVAFTANQLADKIQSTYSAEGFDRNTEYQDDRIAFWHAHIKMVEERPVLGHGIDLSPEYLVPYYTAIGLGNFSKKYPAHNTFLQILVNGGIVGLFFFAAWYLVIAKIPWLRRKDNWAYPIFLQTWIGFALVSLTQNSFQDSEVRYGMALAVAAVWLGGAKKAATGSI